MTNRFNFIDLLRGASVLYIVGFWHLMNYTSGFPGYHNVFTMRMTVVVLGLFVFLSGYLLNSKELEQGWNGVKKFYIRRFFRIYPLYAMAIVLFFIAHLADGTSLLKAGLLISMFYGPPPPTLWFITMIMVFYLLAPLLIISSRQWLRFWMMAVGIFVLFMVISLVSPVSDPRILIYYPAFAGGVYLATLKAGYSKALRLGVITISILSIVLSFMDHSAPESSYMSIPLACSAPLLIFLLSSRFSRFFPVSKTVCLISYAGFVMYLIHRPIYLYMKVLYSKLPLMMDADLQIMLYLYFICLPLVTLISWIIQRCYDQGLKRFQRSIYPSHPT